MAEYLINQPVANVLMKSMRCMGYTFESAVADIIDNSISAKSKNITVKFSNDEINPYIAIIDDGHGMSDTELFDAMKYGSTSKQNNRSKDDLGRFGLGLKSASMSQCKILTVASKKNNEIIAYIWDLNYIEQTKEWKIIKCSDEEINEIENIDTLKELESGTLVLWNDFDIFEKRNTSVYKALDLRKEPLYKYVGLIFHRYIEEGIKFYINNREIRAIDPFLEKHKKTSIQRSAIIPILDDGGVEHKVIATPFVLPYQSDLSKSDMELLGGDENYRNKQGFYVYRNNRLIIWGTWFGTRKHELTKNARIKIDIPNTLDDIWMIDIKKQSATIPDKIKKQLTKAVFDTMDKAKKVQTYRGKIANKDENIEYVWNRRELREDKIIFEINRETELMKSLKSSVDQQSWETFESILMMVEATLPVQQIYVDRAENNVNDNQEILKDEEELIDLGLKLCAFHVHKTADEKIEILSKQQQFKDNKKILKIIRERL